MANAFGWSENFQWNQGKNPKPFIPFEAKELSENG